MNATATSTWCEMLMYLLRYGNAASPTSAGASWKGNASRESLAYRSVWPMSRPVILSPARRLGYKFMAAEAAWVLGGDNRVETIRPFSKEIERFSDDGLTFEGAYGPPFVDQLSYVVRRLAGDLATRQAVCNIWRPRVMDSRDTPCTLSLQWLVRQGELHCVATMRSSDAWTGVPYDVFNFSMMSAYVSLSLHHYAAHHGDAESLPAKGPLPLGYLYLTAGSQHLYEKDVVAADACLKELGKSLEVDALDLEKFALPRDLVNHLWSGAWSDVQPKERFGNARMKKRNTS